MGVVYRAEDTKLKRIVALKFLPPGLDAHEPERARFLQEAQAAAALNHPNICTIYDITEFEDKQFIVMEYVEGKTLRQLVPIPKIQDAIGYAIQIGEALQEAHGKGVVHRDVKTDNIMVNTKNQIKVADFGLAKLKGSMKLTKTSSTVGTLAYMSPEQIQGTEVDARSDIFSFGVVLYEMLTGHLPFRGDYEAAIVYSIVNEEPESIQKHLPAVSSELVHIVNRALEKDPGDRYQNVNDMVIDLRRAKKETSRISRVSFTPSTVVESRGNVPEEQTIRRKKPQRTLFIGGMISVLALVMAMFRFVVFPFRTPRLNPNPNIRTLEIPFTEIGYPSMSRDGNWIAFGAQGAKDEWALYFMNVSKGAPRRLTEERFQDVSYSDISPDGSEVVYAGNPFGKPSGIYIVSSNGGKSRKIAEPGVGCKWHPGGQRIGYIRKGRPTNPSLSGMREFWTIRTDGSENRLEFVDSLSQTRGAYCFDWSPDGNSIIWLRSFPYYEEIFIHDMKSGNQRQLTSYKKPIDEVIWASNGQIVFSSSKGGNTNIWVVPTMGGEAVRITKGTGPDLGMRISADVKRLLFIEQRTFHTLWTADINGSRAQQLTFDNQYLQAPSFSPDKKQISFDMSSADILQPANHIFIMSSDGTDRVQLTAGDAQYCLAEWSPDGKYMTYSSKRIDEPLDSARIYLIEVENPGTSRPIGKGLDVRWINEEEFVTITPYDLPHPHTALYSIRNSEPIKVSEDSTNEFPLRDGKHLVVRDLRKGREGWWLKTMRPEQSAAPEQILSSKYLFYSYPSISLRYILYQQENGEVWRVSVLDGKKERMPDFLNGINPRLNIQMSYDDKELVFLKGRLDSRLVLIENVFK
jgi:serine/threonine protein kinase